MKYFCALGLALAALAGSACGRGGAAAAGSAGDQAFVAGTQAFPGTSFLLGIAHQGVRRVEFEGSWSSVAFRERITTDGQGHYAIEPLEPLTATFMDWPSFELLQRLREGFLFRYRDFSIRDAGLFQRNWRWTALGETSVIARRCQRYRVERAVDGGAPALYEVSVDLQTGIVLAFRQLDGAGGVIASLEYETLELEPELSGIAWHQPGNEETVLDWRAELGPQVGAAVLEPRLLPAGYALRAAATVVDGQSRRWLKLTYLDGIEPLFLLQALPGSGPGAVQQGQSSGVDWAAGSATGPATSRVTVYRVGAATAAQGTLAGHELIAVGKVREAELLDLLESALP
jgi:hypothetical protein